jgi:GT2 family glycosyltransferase
VLERFGFGRRWAYVALDADRRCHGLDRATLRRVYASADLIVNLHGGTLPLPEHAETGRLVFLETDPVRLQVELHDRREEAIAFLEPHCAFFTFAENYGRVTCRLPVSDRFAFKPTRQPVVLDFWRMHGTRPPPAFRTVSNWRQPWRDVVLDGDVYRWSKHHEFLKCIDLPGKTAHAFELALSGCEPDERALLRRHGWTIVPALPLSSDLDEYRTFITGARGEFTVAKDQNVRLRTGWFSDRSATFLAAGRPVVTQDTGFDVVLPTGTGLFAFSNVDEAAAAVDAINADWRRHAQAAREIAESCFSSDVVLRELLAELGLEHARRPARRRPARRRQAFPSDLDLRPRSRRPIVLADATVATVARAPLERLKRQPPRAAPPSATVAVVAHDAIVFTRLCLESLLACTDRPPYELVVVDNGSRDGTPRYLRRLAARFGHVRVIENDVNRGFAAAVNQALAAGRGHTFVLLNNDTIVAPGWLSDLDTILRDPSVGLVGPVTNRIGTEAEIESAYATYGDFLRFAAERARAHGGRTSEVRMAAMFCVALRRDVWRHVGTLDESFGTGTLEDDDYSLRVRDAGLRILCAEGVFVHHFGEASFGRLAPDGSLSRLLDRNRRLFAEKWGREWQPYPRRHGPRYNDLRARVRARISSSIPPGSTFAVASRGDDALTSVEGRRGWHFPRAGDGSFAGYYPATSEDAVAALERIRSSGAEFVVFPETGRWWLEHYGGLRRHLADRYRAVADDDSCVIFSLRSPA